MRVNTKDLLESTVTIFNRIPAEIAEMDQDAYRGCILKRVNAHNDVDRSVDADGTVHVKTVTSVSVPDDVNVYCGDTFDIPGGSFTVHEGDIVFLRGIDISGLVTRDHLIGLGFDYLTVSVYEDLTTNAAKHSGGALTRYASQVWFQAV